MLKREAAEKEVHPYGFLLIQRNNISGIAGQEYYNEKTGGIFYLNLIRDSIPPGSFPARQKLFSCIRWNRQEV